MSQSVRIGEFLQVLKHHEIDVIFEEDDIILWKDDIKVCFPIEQGFISKRFIHRTAKKFGIGIHYFFHPEFLGPEH